MNTNHILSRVELGFWNLTIRTLSQSRVARIFLQKAYQVTHTSEYTSLGILMGISGVIGLASGYVFYFITAR